MATIRFQCPSRLLRQSRTAPRVVPSLRVHASEVGSSSGPAAEELVYNQLLLTILDANPFLSDGSRTAVATTALLAKQHRSKVTVLVVDEPGTTNTEPARRIDSITFHLKERGCEDFKVVERAITSPASVLVGDFADEISADMVVLSSEAVHAKHVDANQLAEFVSCPVLLLP